MLTKRVQALLMIGLTGVLMSTASRAGLFVPDADLWSIWNTADESATGTIDHRDWQYLLDTYLVTTSPDGIHRFDYRAVTPADRARLHGYIEKLTGTDPRRYPRAVQLAYWINLYNALTVEVVLQHYPVKSIRRIYGGLFGTGPWNRKLIAVAGRPLSLNDIEHRILRPIWRDPRIHYAVNCASLGCPNLAAQAFTAENAERLLDTGARAYINHPRGVSFKGGRLTLSKIYKWFAVDFGGTRQGVLAHLQRYAGPELRAQLGGYDGRVRYRYDWGLNGM